MAASISFQATDTDGTSTGDGGTFTFPLTVASAAGQERFIILAAISNSSVGDYSNVTIDGQTATQVGTTSRGAMGGSCAIITAWRAPGTAGFASPRRPARHSTTTSWRR